MLRDGPRVRLPSSGRIGPLVGERRANAVVPRFTGRAPRRLPHRNGRAPREVRVSELPTRGGHRDHREPRRFRRAVVRPADRGLREPRRYGRPPAPPHDAREGDVARSRATRRGRRDLQRRHRSSLHARTGARTSDLTRTTGAGLQRPRAHHRRSHRVGRDGARVPWRSQGGGGERDRWAGARPHRALGAETRARTLHGRVRRRRVGVRDRAHCARLIGSIDRCRRPRDRGRHPPRG